MGLGVVVHVDVKLSNRSADGDAYAIIGIYIVMSPIDCSQCIGVAANFSNAPVMVWFGDKKKLKSRSGSSPSVDLDGQP